MTDSIANGKNAFRSNVDPFETIFTPYFFIDIPETYEILLRIAREKLTAKEVNQALDRASLTNHDMPHVLFMKLIDDCLDQMPRMFTHDLLIKWVKDFAYSTPRDLLALSGISTLFKKVKPNEVNSTITTFVVQSIGSIENIYAAEALKDIAASDAFGSLDEELIKSIVNAWGRFENPMTESYKRVLAKAGIDLEILGLEPTQLSQASVAL